jgi:methylated-DNA-[protein]-cysteine S-methyltransferase
MTRTNPAATPRVTPSAAGVTGILHRTRMETPVGPLVLLASDAGLRAVLWGDEPLQRVRSAVTGESVVDAPDHVVLAIAVTQLGEYLAGVRRVFDVPLDARGSEFQRAAWDALCTIPFGETVSYGEQARRMGDVRKARAVGGANGRNPISIVVPCHRVVGADGSLTGFAGGMGAKAWLLDHERRIAAQI